MKFSAFWCLYFQRKGEAKVKVAIVYLFTKCEREVDRVRVLHSLLHGLRLPPCLVVRVVKVGQKLGRMHETLNKENIIKHIYSVPKMTGLKA